MADRRASELLVECLEAEGVRWVFGIPGEETLDLNAALDASSITFVAVRHEQAAAFMADAIGRLTGRAGVCLGTLGPGATNLVTGIADAFLDRAPLVALTGQGGLRRMHKESHQYLDVPRLLRPVTKWNAQITDARIVPEVVRKAFAVAEQEKPGPTHLELPEDVMAETVADLAPLPRRTTSHAPEPAAQDLVRAVGLIRSAVSPVVLAGNGVARAGASHALREFARATGIGVAHTFMGKGVLAADDPHLLGTVGLQSRDYELAGFGDADLVIAVGYDLVEHAPSHWNPGGDTRIICIDTRPPEVDAHFVTEVDLVGDLYHVLTRLAEECRDVPHRRPRSQLGELVGARLEAARADRSWPMQPPRVLADIRAALGREDVLVSDVGLHKLWIARMYPAYEPNTVWIANGLAGMGYALPTGIAIKLAEPRRKVVCVAGDGGFLMNVQELETAQRLGTGVVCVVWENHQFGSIVWKQDGRFGRHFGTDFGNPDFVALAQAFGLPAWRCEAPDDFAAHLRCALAHDGPSLVVLPIDYSLDVSEGLGTETTTA